MTLAVHKRAADLAVGQDMLRVVCPVSLVLILRSLNNVGRLWRKSPIDLDENEKKLLWSRTQRDKS